MFRPSWKWSILLGRKENIREMRRRLMKDNGSRKRYTPEQKIGALKRHFLDKTAISEVCQGLDLQPTMFYRWQKELFDQGTRAFETRVDRGSERRQQEQRIQALEAKLQKKDEVLAELMEEHLALKKTLGVT